MLSSHANPFFQYLYACGIIPLITSITKRCLEAIGPCLQSKDSSQSAEQTDKRAGRPADDVASVSGRRGRSARSLGAGSGTGARALGRGESGGDGAAARGDGGDDRGDSGAAAAAVAVGGARVGGGAGSAAEVVLLDAVLETRGVGGRLLLGSVTLDAVGRALGGGVDGRGVGAGDGDAVSLAVDVAGLACSLRVS